MSALETLSLLSLSLGVAAVLRVVWLDSRQFSDVPNHAEVADPRLVSPPTVQGLARLAEVARIQAETESLPKAA